MSQRLRLPEFPLSAAQLEQLQRFAERVWREGTLWGLSGRKSLEEVWEKDVLDSLLLFPHLSSAETLLDIGPGAGFPGIPLSIAKPEMKATLLETKQKAVKFLELAIVELGLSSAMVTHGHADEFLKKPSWKHQFDVVVGRAVAPIARFLPWSATFAKGNGRIVLQKGKKLAQELREAEPVMKKLKLVVESIAPGLQGDQKIVVLRKKS